MQALKRLDALRKKALKADRETVAKVQKELIADANKDIFKLLSTADQKDQKRLEKVVRDKRVALKKSKDKDWHKRDLLQKYSVALLQTARDSGKVTEFRERFDIDRSSKT